MSTHILSQLFGPGHMEGEWASDGTQRPVFNTTNHASCHLLISFISFGRTVLGSIASAKRARAQQREHQKTSLTKSCLFLRAKTAVEYHAYSVDTQASTHPKLLLRLSSSSLHPSSPMDPGESLCTRIPQCHRGKWVTCPLRFGQFA